jgi:hypothetical protein
MNCPDCGKTLKPKKSWGGLMACYCLFNGRKPSARQVERSLDESERKERGVAPKSDQN